MNKKFTLGLYFLFCGWGFFFEWSCGFFWSIVGECPWIYLNSALVYTSWEGAPLWGLGGLTTIQLYKAVRYRNMRALGYVAILQVLAMFWIATVSII